MANNLQLQSRHNRRVVLPLVTDAGCSAGTAKDDFKLVNGGSSTSLISFSRSPASRLAAGGYIGEDLSPLTRYLMILQQELLSTPTPPARLSLLQTDYQNTHALQEAAATPYLCDDENFCMLATNSNYLTCNAFETLPEFITNLTDMTENSNCLQPNTSANSEESNLTSYAVGRKPAFEEHNHENTSGMLQNLAKSRLKRKTTKSDQAYLQDDHSEEGFHQSKTQGAVSRRRNTPTCVIKTQSQQEIIDDGYKWRKYGRKTIKRSPHLRSYYKCLYSTCQVKKKVQRSSEDSSIVVTTYEGIHIHPSPSSISRNNTTESTLCDSNGVGKANVNSDLRDRFDLSVQMGLL